MSRIDEIQAIGAIRSSHEKNCYKILYNNSKEDCDVCDLLSEIDTLKTENTTLKVSLERAETAIEALEAFHKAHGQLPFTYLKYVKARDAIADYRSKK